MKVIQLWKDALSDPVANWVVMIFLLICSILIAVYVVGWFRNLALGRDQEPLNPLAEIERLKGEGKIDFVEYQKLKKSAAQTLSDTLLTSKDKANRSELEKMKMKHELGSETGLNTSGRSKSERTEESIAPIDFTEADSGEGGN
jgi:hypothetical protein